MGEEADLREQHQREGCRDAPEVPLAERRPSIGSRRRPLGGERPLAHEKRDGTGGEDDADDEQRDALDAALAKANFKIVEREALDAASVG